MEDRRNPHNPEDNEESTSDNDERDEFLAGWLGRLEQSHQSSELEEDDEEEEEPGLPKRWRRFWRRLFDREVQNEGQGSEPAQPEQRRPILDLSINTEAEADDSENTVDPSEYSPPEEVPQESIAEAGAPTSPAEGMNDSFVADVPDVEPPISPTEVPDSGEGVSVSRTPTLPEAPQQPEPAIRGRHEHRPESLRTLYGRDEEEGREVPAHTHPNRAAAATTLLVGAEFLARRRADRKLKREVERLNQRITEGDQAAKRLKTVAEETKERVAQQVSDRKVVSTPKHAEQLPENHVSSKELRQSEIIHVQPEKRLAPKPSELPERLHLHTEKQPETLRRPEERIEPAEQEVRMPRPEKILETVTVAAEHDLPIERLYERRHEVKDDKTSVTTGAVPVATVLTGMRHTPLYSSRPAVSAASAGVKPPSVTTSPQLYKQAMRRGFWGAVTLLVFIAIIFFTVGS
jgi:hypothetical protein